MTDRWIVADQLRFAVGVVAFLAILSAFRLPIPQWGDVPKTRG
jgi:hypothetical protein